MALRVDRLVDLMEKNNMNQRELAKKIGVTEVTVSRYINDEGRSPRVEIVSKIASVLGTNTDYLMGTSNISGPLTESITKPTSLLPEEFSTPEEAISFLLSQEVIMGFGGFDIDKLSDEDKIQFANELLGQLKLLSYKYKK